jgi:glycosyltransferase involved in cell wall biosynthesis
LSNTGEGLGGKLPVKQSVAVVIPAFRVSEQIVEVVNSIPEFVDHIFVVDDACPDGSGSIAQKNTNDKRVSVIFNETNQGVGGAVVAGFKAVLAQSNAQIVVKVDGDGQMDARLIPKLIAPIIQRSADYTKGNRFDSIEDLEQMPKLRILGNAALSLFSKFSSGYWNITDPTNGFVAIHRSALDRISLDKLSKGYFFESDLLFRLSIIKAVVLDVPMTAKYGTEKSNLKIRKVLFEFPWRHTVNLLKRTFYNYYLREWNVGSLQLPLGLGLSVFGLVFGLQSWATSAAAGVATSAGQVMIAAVSLILGFQLLLSFLTYDVSAVPRRPRQLDAGDL